MNFIEIEHLTHRYEGAAVDVPPALSEINLSIKKGEFVAILGANGSGKSTLAKHLNALIFPTKGRVLIDGRDTLDAAALWQIRQLVGMVFQNPDNQIIAAIVEDDVAFGPENLGVLPDEIKERVTGSLLAVRMEKYRQFAPHLLSGGQKQRIAIAGALAMETKCLVLDEPTAMLDPIGRAEVLATVKRLHKERGITVIFITHFMDEAAAAERVIVMEKGNIALDAPPRQAFSETALMKRCGLDVPLAVKIAGKLRDKGVKLKADILTDEELITALCR